METFGFLSTVNVIAIVATEFYNRLVGGGLSSIVAIPRNSRCSAVDTYNKCCKKYCFDNNFVKYLREHVGAVPDHFLFSWHLLVFHLSSDNSKP